MLDDPCDFCPAFLQPQDVAVMLEMSDPEVVRPARTLADDLGVDVKAVRATQRRLRDLGLARDGSLWSYDDGLLCGRGTWLLRLGLIIREGLAEIIPSEFRRVIE